MNADLFLVIVAVHLLGTLPEDLWSDLCLLHYVRACKEDLVSCSEGTEEEVCCCMLLVSGIGLCTETSTSFSVADKHFWR